MLGGQDASAARELFRQFLHSTIAPVAEIITPELADKLDTPDLAFNFDSLFASDLTGRARAYGTLVNAGMDPAQAGAIAQLLPE